MDLEPQLPTASESEVSDLGPSLSPQARLRGRAISMAAVLLALLVVVAGLPALRQDALTLLIAPTPTPTLRSLPGADTFYFLATPPRTVPWYAPTPVERQPALARRCACQAGGRHGSGVLLSRQHTGGIGNHGDDLVHIERLGEDENVQAKEQVSGSQREAAPVGGHADVVIRGRQLLVRGLHTHNPGPLR